MTEMKKMTVNQLPPDIDELNHANHLIDVLQQHLQVVNDQIDVLRGAGPESVLAPAATHYKNLVDLENLIEALRLKVYHIKEGYQFHVLPRLFHEASTDTTKTLNGYTISMADDLSVSIPADRKPDAYDWLEQNGYGDIIQSTVNSSTLKATMKGILKDGLVVPEDVFKMTVLRRYTVRKSSYKTPVPAYGDGAGQ